MKLSSLTIMMPAFNEERIIENSIKLSEKAAQEIALDYEILIIDDGSRDRTPEIIKQFSKNNPRIRTIRLERQMGYGKVLSTGFLNAKKDFVFYTDSDLPIDISKELSKAAALISGDIDAVIGYRTDRKDTPLRRMYSTIYNFMARILFGVRVRDVNFSCKLVRRSVFDTFKLQSRSVFIDAELLANLKFFGFKVKEFPATYIPRTHGSSNFDSPIYAFKVFIEMLIFWMRHQFMPGNPKKK